MEKGCRICTITCHDCYNHGASLQTYALMTYLSRLGHQVAVIDYKPDYMSGHYRLLTVNSPRWQANWVRRAVYITLKLPGRLRELPRKWAFDRFTRQYLRLTPVRYAGNRQLKDAPPEADVYVCGSDQIWNCQLPNGNDPAFYLDFVPPGKKKISYAASFSMESLPQELKPVLKERIDRLDAISVRETRALALLQDLGITRGVQVADPVFLLERRHWEEMATCHPGGNYVLIYCFDNNEKIAECAAAIAAKKGCRVYSVNPTAFRYGDKNFPNASPTDFLGLIRNASHVVSNSFHAVAFSVLFQREFTVTGRVESVGRLNSRMQSLLDALGIPERFQSVDTLADADLSPIDYVSVDRRLQSMIARSKAYLDGCLRRTPPATDGAAPR